MQTMMKVSLLFLLLLTTSIFAQSDQGDYSHLRWEGTVDGKVLLKINRRRVTYDVISGVPVQRQRYDFTDPLPFKNTRVEVRIEEGRGNVRVIEQPHERNDYTAIIEINDSSSGQSNYSIDVSWEKSFSGNSGNNSGNNNSYRRNQEDDYFDWQGRVDGESILYIRGEDVRVDDISGNGISNAKYRSSRPIPSRSMTLSLVETSGRGEITLIEQPDNRNDYTAAVRIRDKQNGSGLYSFALTWAKRGGRDRRDDNQSNNGNHNNSYVEARRGMVWSGRVDGTDLISIRGDQVTVQHQAGMEISDMNYRFDQRLPATTTSVSVRKIKGRGKVNVVQQPDRSNGYTAIIQIEDKDSGANNYELEVSW